MTTHTDDALPLGTDLNGYRLDSKLGEGGMAAVYRATQTSLNRPVAIKVLHSGFARRKDFVARFERESEALGQLQHPNIVSVIDRGLYRDHYYFVMELVEGSDLDGLLAEYEFEKRQMIQIVNEVGKGVAYVHQLGIVHRDMKPANILIGKAGSIKVSDFGIASIARGTSAGRPITGEGASMGTGVYMAPEQMADAKNVDHRADIYALGATFYKLITRSLPTGAFPKPSEVRDDVSDEVDALIMKALDPDPAVRPQSARDFCKDLILALRKEKKKKVDLAAPVQMGSVALDQLKVGKGKKKKKKGAKAESAALGLAAKAIGIALFLFAAMGGAAAWSIHKRGTPSDAPVDPVRAKQVVDGWLSHQSEAAFPTPPPETPVAPSPTPAPAQTPLPERTAAPRTPEPATPALAPDIAATPPPGLNAPPPPERLTSIDSMIVIRNGTTTIGRDDDPYASPEHRATTPYIFIDRCEVSNADYALFVAAGLGNPPSYWGGDAPSPAIAKEPVHGVSRAEAEAFADWVGKRLPTEQEWERAASNQGHGRARTVYPWGDDPPGPKANVRTGRLDDVDAATDDATALGVMRLGGNVAEWTSSNFEPYPGAAPSSASFPPGLAVVRGGSALDFAAQPPPDERSAQSWGRRGVDPSTRTPGVGFRCVRDAATSP